jgi:hypothetical protein
VKNASGGVKFALLNRQEARKARLQVFVASEVGKWLSTYATECGHEVYILEDWDTPRFCKECKAENDAKRYDTSYEDCGTNIRAHTDWEHPPKFCDDCKNEFAPKSASCEHYNNSFTIPMGRQINCKEHG